MSSTIELNVTSEVIKEALGNREKENYLRSCDCLIATAALKVPGVSRVTCGPKLLLVHYYGIFTTYTLPQVAQDAIARFDTETEGLIEPFTCTAHRLR